VPNTTLSEELRLDHMAHTIIPYRLRLIADARDMLALECKYGLLTDIDLMIDINGGSQISAFRSVLSSVTQPTITLATIYCRCLLEFLGLGIDKKANPVGLIALRNSRRSDDVGIEHFNGDDGPLSRLTPSDAEAHFPETQVAVAWATTIAVANERVAHSTNDRTLAGTDTMPMLKIAFDTVPELIGRALYDKLGIGRPMGIAPEKS